MTIWHIYYSKNTGKITRIASLAQNMLPEEAVLECANINPENVVLTHYVDQGILTAKLSELPDHEEQIKQLKSNRQTLLLDSDWTQIPNNPLTVERQQEWAVYRQALRDITIQPGYPFTVIWPTPPQG